MTMELRKEDDLVVQKSMLPQSLPKTALEQGTASGGRRSELWEFQVDLMNNSAGMCSTNWKEEDIPCRRCYWETATTSKKLFFSRGDEQQQFLHSHLFTLVLNTGFFTLGRQIPQLDWILSPVFSHISVRKKNAFKNMFVRQRSWRMTGERKEEQCLILATDILFIPAAI